MPCNCLRTKVVRHSSLSLQHLADNRVSYVFLEEMNFLYIMLLCMYLKKSSIMKHNAFFSQIAHDFRKSL